MQSRVIVVAERDFGNSSVIRRPTVPGMLAVSLRQCGRNTGIQMTDDDVLDRLNEEIEFGDAANVVRAVESDHTLLQLKTEVGWTLLFYAAIGHRIELTKKLLTLGAETDISDSLFARTPLHYAAIAQDQEIAETLLRHGADFTLRDVAGKPPILYAIHNSVIETFLSYGAPLDLNTQIRLGQIYEAKRFIESNPKFIESAAQPNFLLDEAIGTGDTALVRTLLNRGVPPSGVVAPDLPVPTVTSPLIRACGLRKPIDLIFALLASGADPNYIDRDNYTALRICESNGYGEATKALREHGATR